MRDEMFRLKQNCLNHVLGIELMIWRF